jgi:hypothetical protein
VQEQFPSDSAPGCTSLVLRADGPGGAYRVHDEFAMTGCPEAGGG